MYVWDHYVFTGDTNFLRNSAYPMLKETCQFWQQHLKSLPYATNGVPAGTLVVTNGWSPETGVAREDGVTCDQEFIWDVFNNYQQAAGILNTDAVYAATVSNLQANLLLPRLGPWGELRPWFYSADSPAGNGGASSEMEFCGLYPGRQITPEAWPALAAGARVKLNTYTDRYDWAYVQHMARYARLHDWWSAHYWLWQYYQNVLPNLSGYNQVAQMDSCIGVTAGIAETLLQSHAGFINLLPALPAAWSAGSVSGLRARGGYTVGITWTNAAAAATITPDFNGTCVVHVPNLFTVSLGGVPVSVTTNAAGNVQWTAATGNSYTLQWVLPPFPAQLPAPMDYAAGVNIGASLGWLAGGTNYLNDVYFGTSSNVVASAFTNSSCYQGRVSATNYSLPLLLPNTAYFWRVDEISGTNIGAGAVWQFTTAASFAATNPSPAVAQTGVVTNTALSWTPGASWGLLHDVYFGASSNAVAGATTNSAQYQGRTAATNVFPGINLQTNTTYYWRVDEVDGTNISIGPVWYFTTTLMQGATFIWNAGASTTSAQDGSGIWGSGRNNWLNGSANIAWIDQNLAQFGINTTTNCLVTITNLVTPAGITFSSSGGGTYTLTNGVAGGINLSGFPVITLSNSATISAVLSGSGSPMVRGSGILSLTAQNTFTGPLTIVSGTVNLPTAISGSGTTLACSSINLSPGSVLTCNDGAFGWYGNNNVTGLTINIINAVCQANGSFGVAYTLSGGSMVGTGYGSGQRLDLGVSGGFNASIATWPSATTSVLNPTGQILLRGDSGQTVYPFTVAAGTTSSGVDLDVQVPINQNSSACSLVKSGSGVMQLDGANGYTGATTVSGGTLLVNGSLSAASAVSVQSGGLLAGTGTVNGALTVHAGGTLAAGVNQAMGALTCANTISLSSGSTAFLRISKTGGALTSDTLKGFTTLAYGGTLVVTNITSDGRALTNGDIFYLFPKGSGAYAGSFAAYNLPPLATGLIWNTTQLGVNGSLQVLSQSAALTPSFSPPGGAYLAALGALTLNVSCPLSGATIYYTTNGNVPGGGSPSGLTPVTVLVPTNATMTIQAFAAAGPATGVVASATYSFTASAGPTWTNVAGGSWAAASNWLNNTIGQGGGVTADFSRLTLVSNPLVTLNSSPVIGNLIFGDMGNAYHWTLNPGSGGTLTLAGSNASTLTVNNQTMTLGAVVAGTNVLIKAGTGILTLTNANTYTGGTIVSNGIVVETLANAGGTGALTINSGAEVSYQVGAYAQAKFSALNIIGGAFSADGVSQNSVNCVGKPVLMQGGTLTSINGLVGPENAGGYGNFLLNGGVLTVSGTNQSIICATTFSTANGASFNVGVTGAGVDLMVTSVINNGGSPTANLVKSGAGIMQLAGVNTYLGSTTVTSGTLLVSGSVATNTVTVQANATLGGSGIINGPVTVQNGGTLTAGSAALVGNLSISNTLTLSAGGTNFLRVSKTGGLATNDWVKGLTGTLTLAGTLVVTNVTGDSTALAAGDSFRLFGAPAYAGSFANFILPALASNLVWTTASLAGNGTLGIASMPVITNQPQSLAVNPGSPASFTVGATGTAALAYQWQKNGVSLAGAVANVYAIASAAATNAGNYRVIITNNFGAVTSQVAHLIVSLPPVIGGVHLSGAAGFSVTATAAAGETCLLLGASNLAPPVVWQPLMTNTADTNGVFNFSDPQATNYPTRFYRFGTP